MEVEQRFVPTGTKRRYQFPALVAIDKALFGAQALDWAFPHPLQSALQSVLHPEQEEQPIAKETEPTFTFEAKRAYESFLAEWPQLHQAWIEETRKQPVQSDSISMDNASANYTYENKPSTPHLFLRKGKDTLPLLGSTPQRSTSASSVDEADTTAAQNKAEITKSGVPAQWTETTLPTLDTLTRPATHVSPTDVTLERASPLSREGHPDSAEDDAQVALTSEDTNLSALIHPPGQPSRVLFESYQHDIDMNEVLADSSDEEESKPDYDLTSTFE